MRTIIKGNIPFSNSIVWILNVFLTRKRFIPIGGVIRAISIFVTYNIPNHSGLYPSAITMGTKMGIVNIIIVIPSIKQPRIRRTTMMQTITSVGDIPID